jgi:DNA repair protein RecO (recombination protein O)
MVTDTEGIVLRQTKAMGGRRMISLFSKKFGKISVGTTANEGGRNKSALAVRPFVYGRYELFKTRDSYNLNKGQVLKSYYAIGEDLDKYMSASYVLELTDKLLPEEIPQPRIFTLLGEFLDALEKRKKKQDTLVMAYMVKLLDILGTMPELACCTSCSKKLESSDKFTFFSISDGGIICSQCKKELANTVEAPLIYEVDIGIIEIIKYFQKMPLSAFEKIALDDTVKDTLQKIIKEYIFYHMDVRGLKSESLLEI